MIYLQEMANRTPENNSKINELFNKKFEFDYCFDENTTQQALFHYSFIEKLAEVMNSNKSLTIFTYGATNTGKTYTYFIRRNIKIVY